MKNPTADLTNERAKHLAYAGALYRAAAVLVEHGHDDFAFDVIEAAETEARKASAVIDDSYSPNAGTGR